MPEKIQIPYWQGNGWTNVDGECARDCSAMANTVNTEQVPGHGDGRVHVCGRGDGGK